MEIKNIEKNIEKKIIYFFCNVLYFLDIIKKFSNYIYSKYSKIMYIMNINLSLK